MTTLTSTKQSAKKSMMTTSKQWRKAARSLNVKMKVTQTPMEIPKELKLKRTSLTRLNRKKMKAKNRLLHKEWENKDD